MLEGYNAHTAQEDDGPMKIHHETTLGALLALLLATAATGQPPAEPTGRFADELDVEVVNVDVVVSSEDGSPVPDLTAEDFEVLDDGQPVRITHFAKGNGSTGGTDPLHLVLLFNDAEIPPSDRPAAYAGVRQQLDRLLGAADRVLVARQGAGIQIAQPFTSDRALVEAALDRLQTEPPGVPADSAARKAVLDEIRFGDAASSSAIGPAPARGGEMQTNTELAAATSLTSVRAYTERRQSETLQSLAALDRLVSALGGLPGRKALLLVGAGYDLRPGESVYQSWLDKYRTTSAARGGGSVDMERSGQDLRDTLRQVAAGASANRVALYSASPAGLGGGAQARPDFRMLSSTASTGETPAQESLRLLTTGTGGLSVFNLEGIDRLAERMDEDLKSRYSLAYPSPHFGDGGDGAWHSVEVRARRPGVRVRSATGYRAKSPDQRTQERAAAALLLDMAENPLDLVVELAEPTRDRDDREGAYTVPVTVKIPLARLMLLPRGGEHQGKLAIFLVTRDGDGNLSPTHKLEAPIRIPNAQMVTAMGQTGSYATSFRVRAGEHRLAVAVRDDVAAVESAVGVDVKVAESEKVAKKRGRRGKG